MSTVRKTVSMQQKIYDAAQQRMADLGFIEFSDYIQALMRADAGLQPMMLQEKPPPYKVSSEAKHHETAEAAKKGAVSGKPRVSRKQSS